MSGVSGRTYRQAIPHVVALLGVVTVGVVAGRLLAANEGGSPVASESSPLPSGLGNHVPGECTWFWFAPFAIGQSTPTLEWTAAAFAEDPTDEARGALLSALENSEWNQRNAGSGTIEVPLNVLRRPDPQVVPVESIASALRLDTEGRPLELLYPTESLVRQYQHGLVMSLAYLEAGTGPDGGYGWLLAFRAPDRNPFPGGLPDPAARCEAAFTLAGGSLTRLFADDPSNVLRFRSKEVDYVVRDGPAAGMSAGEIAGALAGR